MDKTLKLNVKHKWFEIMVTGQKRNEYRKPSEWIRSRLWYINNTDKNVFPVYEPRDYDFVEIRSGYGKHRPYFIAEFRYFSESLEEFYIGYGSGLRVKVEPRDYIIKLGKIIKIGNYETQPRLGR